MKAESRTFWWPPEGGAGRTGRDLAGIVIGRRVGFAGPGCAPAER